MASHNQTVARRYSRALWMMTEGKKENAEAWLSALEAFVASMDQSKELSQVLDHPAFSIEKKWAVTEEVLKLVKSPAPLNRFIKFVLEAGRISSLSDISEAFKDLVLSANQTVEAFVETALPLSEQQSRLLVEKLQKATGKKVTLTTRLAPELLAGLRVKILGRSLDASLNSNLGLMQQALLKQDKFSAEA